MADDAFLPSAELETKTVATVVQVLTNAIDWSAIEALEGHFYEYLMALMNKEGPRSFLVSEESGELAIGAVAWSENGDDLMATYQVRLSEIVLSGGYDDQLLDYIKWLEGTLAILRAEARLRSLGIDATKERL